MRLAAFIEVRGSHAQVHYIIAGILRLILYIILWKIGYSDHGLASQLPHSCTIIAVKLETNIMRNSESSSF